MELSWVKRSFLFNIRPNVTGLNHESPEPGGFQNPSRGTVDRDPRSPARYLSSYIAWYSFGADERS